MKRFGALGLVLLAALAGCSHQSSPSPPRPPATAGMHHGPLTDYLPAAGLRWLVVGSPSDLLRNSELRQAIEVLLPLPRRTAFAETSGVDPFRVSEGCIAGYDDGVAYLVRGHEMQHDAERAFRSRLFREPLVQREGPAVTRMVAVIGGEPESFLQVDGMFFGVIAGNPSLGRIVSAYARGRLSKSPTTLDGASLSTLPKSMSKAPLSFYLPGPFMGEWAEVAGGLLRNAIALGVSLHPGPTGRVRLNAYLSGDFAPEVDSLRTRAEGIWTVFVESGLGKLFEMDGAETRLILETSRTMVIAKLELDLGTVRKGLRSFTQPDLWRSLL